MSCDITSTKALTASDDPVRVTGMTSMLDMPYVAPPVLRCETQRRHSACGMPVVAGASFRNVALQPLIHLPRKPQRSSPSVGESARIYKDLAMLI